MSGAEADSTSASEATPLFPPTTPTSRARHRVNSSVVDIVLENIGDVVDEVVEEVQAITHDMITFEPLDQDEIVEKAIEIGAIDLSEIETASEKEEAIEQFVHPEDTFNELPEGLTQANPKLGILPLAVIVFYNVSGGPFGVETSVRAGGNLFALVGFIVGPLVWSMQEALLTAELGTTFPEAGAGVAWVEEAFGPSAGWLCGYLGWIAGATDNAIYPVLFMDYLLQHISSSADEAIELHPVRRFLALSSASIILGYINWRGLPLVGSMSTWICLVAMSPFIVLIVAGSFKVDVNRLMELPNSETGGTIMASVMWRPFLNNLFWNLNSFDAAGSFASEIDNAPVMFPRAMFYAVVLVSTCYFFPLLIAIGASHAEREDWTDGYLAVVTGDVVGPWLGAWTVFAAGISNIALFQAELSADAFQLMGMADRGHLPKILSKRSRHGTPTFGIILGVIVIIVMDLFSDFDQLIEMLNFNYAIALLMEYGAFFKLRISKPDLVRPYRIPMNTFGCGLLFLPTVLLTIVILCLANVATYAMFSGVVVSGLFVFYAKQRSQYQRQGGRPEAVPQQETEIT